MPNPKSLASDFAQAPDELPVDEATIRKLHEIGLGDVVTALLSSGKKGLSCDARRCANNDKKGHCRLPATSIQIDRNWECRNFRRR